MRRMGASKITDAMVILASKMRDDGEAWKAIGDHFGVSESGLRDRVTKYRKAKAGTLMEIEAANDDNTSEESNVVQLPVPEPVQDPVQDAGPGQKPEPMRGRKLVDVQVVATARTEASTIMSEMAQAVAVMGIDTGQGTYDAKEKLWVGVPDTTAAATVAKWPYGAVIVGDETLQCKQCGGQLRAHCFPFEHKTRFDPKTKDRLPASEWRRDTSRCRFVCRPAEDRRNKGDRNERRAGAVIEGRRFEHEQCRDATCETCRDLNARAREIRAEGKAKGEAAHAMASEEHRLAITQAQAEARARYEASVSGGKTITEAQEEAGVHEDQCPYCLGYKWIVDPQTLESVKCQSEFHPQES